MQNLTVADFFCGAGGFSEGFYQEGFNVVFALDNWKPAYSTHEHNHKHCKTVCMNILELDTPEKIDALVPDTDIIIGSPPCISFSNSNASGKADKTLGLQLIQQYLKIIHYKKNKPQSRLKYWLMENVPNSIKYIKECYTAAELGLDPALPDLVINNKHILMAADYGSPQGRKRAIVGDYILPAITHPEEGDKIHTSKILAALGPPLQNTQAYITDFSFPELTLAKNDVTDHFYDSEIPSEWAAKAKHLKTDHGFMGKMDFPDRLDRLCRTIMATESYCSRESLIWGILPQDPLFGGNSLITSTLNTQPSLGATNGKSYTQEGGVGEHPPYRAPTIRELACLMGFPIDYQFSGTNSTSKHKQIGNAVCVHMSMALARAIKEALQLTLTKKPRTLIKATINLNDLTEPLFAHHIKAKPKKLTSKFHVHVPYLKINQLRVELDNLTSNFAENDFHWQCLLHKGSGPKALKTAFPNTQFHANLATHRHFQEVTQFIETHIKPRMSSRYLFQAKQCGLDPEQDHYAPAELLDRIAEKIKTLALKKEDTIELPELDRIFQAGIKKNSYSLEIVYSLYMLNAAVNCVA
jgi:DNA (cytosine-5)-methyltransferase 1